MTHRKSIHPAMTAIAAAIALSSTPLFAQSAEEPVVTPTPAVEAAPAPVAADPIAPVADTSVAADPVAAKATTSVHKTTTTKTTTTKTTAARSRPAPARASTAVRTVAAAPAAAVAAPVAEAPITAPPPIVPATPIAAEPIATPPATADTSTIDVLPTAGLGGLGLLLLGGAGLAFRSRRRRRAEEAEEAEWQQQQIEAQPEVAAEPAMVAEPEPELVLAGPAVAAASTAQPTAESDDAKFIGPVTDLPEGFDISRFGPNVQDAYRGPTEDNPSASLKTRLSRASGMDQQERKLDAEVEAATGEPVLDEADATPAAAAPATKPAVIRHSDGDFMLGRATKKPTVRTTFTH
jgi:hypothetical protein